MTENPAPGNNRAPLYVLVLVILGLGAYASWLNRQFYLQQAPFFDSAAYTNYLNRVMGSTEVDGLREGIEVALDSSTAPLPGIEAVLLAVAHVPISSTRQMGIWLQVAWLLFFGVSLYLYWRDGRKRGPWASLLFTIPFVFFSGMFRFNGGLPDFRLDLFLYISLATASVWLLRTYSSASFKPWLLSGVFLTIASLSRATAPVYWGAMVGPIILFRWFTSAREERRLVVRGVVWMLLPTVVVELPYFLTHFSFLYYYYAQWNADANARLPLAASITHAKFAFEHLGWALTITGALFAAAVLKDHGSKNRGRVPRLDWKLLYLGFAPVLLMVLRGSGLNPYVTMPAVFGWLVFLFAPLRENGPVLRSVWSKAAAILVLGACLWNAAQAPGQKAYPETHMQAIRQGIDWMREDSLRRKLPRVDFVAFHNWNYHPQFVRNVLFNEYGYQGSRWKAMSPEGIPWEPFHKWKHLEASYEVVFTAAVPIEWQEGVEGNTDAEKIEWMYNVATKEIDYVFFPDEPTIDFMEKYIAHNYINTKVRAIRKRFLESGAWQRIGTPLAITDFEKVELYGKRQ